MKSPALWAANSPGSHYGSLRGNGSPGFTLTELLAVIVTVGILALTLFPVLARSRVQPQATLCTSNFRQLAVGWLMYASDNKDSCAGNFWQHEQQWLTYANENWVSGWEGADGSGGNGATGDAGGPDNTNTALLVNPTYSTLGAYTRSPALYLCPSCIILAPVSPGGPKSYRLCRTVSMNCWMGYNTDCPGSSGGSNPIPDYSNCKYKNFGRTSAIAAGISPASAYVFMDERGESIDDGWYEVNGPNSGDTIYDWPSDYHNGAATIAFADGHVEAHRWLGTGPVSNNEGTTVPQQAIIAGKWGSETVGIKYDADCVWLQQHATCLK